MKRRQDDRALYFVVALAIVLAAIVLYFGYFGAQQISHGVIMTGPTTAPVSGEIKYTPPDGQAIMVMPRLNPKARSPVVPSKPRRKTAAPPAPPVSNNP
jgi:hypothetical protein